MQWHCSKLLLHVPDIANGAIYRPLLPGIKITLTLLGQAYIPPLHTQDYAVSTLFNLITKRRRLTLVRQQQTCVYVLKSNSRVAEKFWNLKCPLNCVSGRKRARAPLQVNLTLTPFFGPTWIVAVGSVNEPICRTKLGRRTTLVSEAVEEAGVSPTVTVRPAAMAPPETPPPPLEVCQPSQWCSIHSELLFCFSFDYPLNSW